MPGKTPLGVPMTLVSMQTSDRLRTLERLRDRIAEEIDATDSAHHVERLAARLTAVLAEIDALPGDEMGAADQIAARRQARRAGRAKGRGGATPA